jgi:hypothetical protein
MPPIPWPSSQLAVLKAAIALAAVLLLAARSRRETDQQPPSRLQEIGLAGLGLVAFLAWFNFGAYGLGTYIHHYEFFHYYLGSKYSSELGYTGLYACVGAAEIEEGRRKEVYTRWMRDLRTNEIRQGDAFVADFAHCRNRFTSADRWNEFKHDVEYFRTHLDPEVWHHAVTDHGYNPSPVWTVLGKALASTGPASPGQIAFLSWVDPLLLLGIGTAVGWAFGWRVLSVALIWWGTNHLSRYYFIGGAFLRHDWLLLAILALCFAKMGRMTLSGAALTWSALIRVFPAIIATGLLLKILIDSVQAKRLCITAAHARFLAGGLLALAVWLPLSLTVRGLDDRPFAVWDEFFSNTRRMAETSSVNQVGLPAVLAFDSSHRSARVLDFWVDTPWDVWRAGRSRTLHERRALQMLLVTGFMVLLAFAVAGRDDWIALTLGVAAIPILVELSNYYYGVLLALAFLWPLRPIAGIGLAATAVLSNVVLGLWAFEDDRYTAISIVVLLLVTYVAAAFARRAPLKKTAVTSPTGLGSIATV